MLQPNSYILLIEDDVEIRNFLCEVLLYEGYQITAVSNGQEAFNFLDQCAVLPRLILLDLMMPIMDGSRFRRLQRAHPACSKIPVVVLSADSFVEKRSQAIQADGFLKKPIAIQTLVDVVQHYCR